MSIPTITRAGRLFPARTAFYVCDIQERLRGVVSNYPQLVDTAVKMVRGAELMQIPVVIVEQVPRVFKNTDPKILAHLPDNLKVGPFPKVRFGGVFGTPQVGSFLKEKDIQSVVVFGAESHVCLMQTVLELLDHGRDVHVLADGVSSVNPEEVPLALARMRQAGAWVTSSETVLYQLMGDSSAPNFRAFAKLLKELKDTTTETMRTAHGTKL